MSYNKYYSEWANNPLSFWDEKAKDVSFKSTEFGDDSDRALQKNFTQI